jgi:large subunit ribosomal protein L32e
MVNPRKKPKFRRWGSQNLKRLKSSWRKPRGLHSKIRVRKKSKIKMPSIGYGTPRKLKHLHPSGLKEVLVFNANGLQNVNPKEEAVKIAHSVGKRKREEILKKAEELKIKILNP